MSQTSADDCAAGDDEARQALAEMVHYEPERHDLVIGFVGAIGTSWDPVLKAFQESLRQFNYSTEKVVLADLLDDEGLLGDLDPIPWTPLPTRESPEYYKERMDAGDKLRSHAKSGSALAALAIQKIANCRQDSTAGSPVAYLLKSLKHPEEVALLRHVYGDALLLVGVACRQSERDEVLRDRLSRFKKESDRTEQLVARDESDQLDTRFGQNVRDTYALADVFIQGSRGVNLRADVDRFVDTVFGYPFSTPSPAEEGMRFAQDASLRSAAAGRQVGAVLVPVVGTPVVAGTNEVPKPGGGQYWAGDTPDFRDFMSGEDPNPIYTQKVVQELLERLASNKWLIEELRSMTGPALFARAYEDDSGSSILRGARAAALIEFTRCLHAEQAAIINAARSGVASQGGVLYTTTFPCHECAKMIIGAGIVEVHYIEPYPKSLVDRLYRDMIDTSPPLNSSSGLVMDKVPFYQFVGIAPKWYSRAFIAGERRDGLDLVEFDRAGASPNTHSWSAEEVKTREAAVVLAIARIFAEYGGNSYRHRDSADDDNSHTETGSDPVSETYT